MGDLPRGWSLLWGWRGDCLGSWPPTSCDSLRGKDQNTQEHWGRDRFADGGSVFAMCSVKSRDVHTHKGRRPPQQDGHTAIRGDKEEAHTGYRGSEAQVGLGSTSIYRGWRKGPQTSTESQQEVARDSSRGILVLPPLPRKTDKNQKEQMSLRQGWPHSLSWRFPGNRLWLFSVQARGFS